MMHPEWPHMTVGRHSYGGRVVDYPGDPPHMVEIGSYTSIATGVEFMIGGNHPFEWGSTFPFRARFDLPGAFEDGMPASRGPICIGSDVWIGAGALILSGVTVGHGAVIGAHAVVARDVRSYAIVAGNPAREARRRFTDEQVDALLSLAWWTWPHEELLTIVALLNGADVDELIQYGLSRDESGGATAP